MAKGDVHKVCARCSHDIDEEKFDSESGTGGNWFHRFPLDCADLLKEHVDNLKQANKDLAFKVATLESEKDFKVTMNYNEAAIRLGDLQSNEDFYKKIIRKLVE